MRPLFSDGDSVERPVRAGVLSVFALNEEWLTNVLEEGSRTSVAACYGVGSPAAIRPTTPGVTFDTAEPTSIGFIHQKGLSARG